jgi:hypothetical protein
MTSGILPENYLEEAAKENSLNIARTNIQLCRENKEMASLLRLIYSTHQRLSPGQSDQLRRPEIMDQVKHILEDLGDRYE